MHALRRFGPGLKRFLLDCHDPTRQPKFPLRIEDRIHQHHTIVFGEAFDVIQQIRAGIDE